MKKNIFLFAISLLATFEWLHAENVEKSINLNDSLTQILLEEVTILPQISQVQSAGVAKTLTKKQLQENNIASNVPDVIKQLPSVVSYNEGGSAVGNTYLSIRGTNANRINVTLNGMPLANPESQEMYWVNLPNLSSSLRSIQVQRGVGNSVVGTASFGGSLSLQTDLASDNPYASVSSSFGSYNTLVESVATGTGLIANKFTVDMRYSFVKSDGYINNGKVNHKNLFANINYNINNKQLIKLVYLHGIQHTGITWEGATPEDLNHYGNKYNPAGSYYDDNGNKKFYSNETDNYYSHIVQSIYSYAVSSDITFNANVGYNSGYGYYENYKQNKSLLALGLPNQYIEGSIYKRSDIISRKKMNNDYYFVGAFVNIRRSLFEIITGANYSLYDGKHYGKLLWVKYNENIPKNYQWYDNRAKKRDVNFFARVNFFVNEKFNVGGELQGRFINYKLHGEDDDLQLLDKMLHYNFFNPKINALYLITPQQKLIGSVSIANREPQRSDLKESIKGNGNKPIQPERLYDFEIGHSFDNGKWNINTNLYYMKYHNQLVQTGQLASNGYRYQQNVKNSYRLGVELDADYIIDNRWSVGANFTLSRNKIKNYTAYYNLYNNVDDFELVGQVSDYFKSTDISFSPSLIGAANLTYKPFLRQGLLATLTAKYVGKRFYDNTSSRNKELSDYLLMDFNLIYSLKLKGIKLLEFQLVLNNLLNKHYYGNAWTETVYFETGETKEIIYRGFYPQATRNIMGRISLEF